VQIESRLSLTGSKADHRIAIHPCEQSASLRQLLESLLSLAAGGEPAANPRSSPLTRLMCRLARHIWSHRGRALVICGSTESVDQLVCRQINHVLGAYGHTIDLDSASRQRLGNRASQRRLLEDLRSRSVGVLLFAGANPLHASPDAEHWRDLLRNVPTIIAATERLDETAHAASLRCPVPDAFASWGDLEPVEGLYCLRQPLLQPGPGQRPLAALLTAWYGEPTNAYELVREHWSTVIHQPELDGPFDAFWDRAVRAGWIQRAARQREFRPRPVDARHETSADLSAAALVLAAYPPVATLDGRHGYNPWLLELPDPLTKVTWGNPASLAPSRAAALGVSDGDVIRIELSDDASQAIELAVVVQPGQHDGVVAVPIGFGQDVSRRFASIDRGPMSAATNDGRPVGVNVAPLVRGAHPRVTIRRTDRHEALARTQIDPVESGLREIRGAGPSTATLVRRVASLDDATRPPPEAVTAPRAWRGLWGEPRDPTGIRWGMAIDLDACIGCSACVVACQIENNIPVVGAEEVRRHREMHWLRIDRYYHERAGRIEVGHQPMTCHHCGHAPCESVCPVLATTHSSDGLNQQVYSRCVGTRYCMNNCPFKVRRFNWFENRPDETFDTSHLNPEVTIRSRGVVEKCTFCAHRIQDARLAAQQQGRDLSDDAVQPACAQSCPARAIAFGNLADPQSKVSLAISSGRAYALLDELNLAPAVTYLAIRTRDAGFDDAANPD
jgi:molybdopterin-containing oxidoreductase family iron-sulfur binding subunit